MFGALSVLVMLAAEPAGQTSMPRQADTPGEHAPSQREGLPADPLFDKPLTATDDAAFVRAAVESGRQGVMDARAAESGLSTPELRAAASKIGRQQERTLDRLESLARSKGWDLPQSNPLRSGSVPVSSPVRTSADFIIQQIAQHQATLESFRAQAGGRGDSELRRLLREAVPGYQQNLEMLLGLKL
jgi:predicted outer membrane protein